MATPLTSMEGVSLAVWGLGPIPSGLGVARPPYDTHTHTHGVKGRMMHSHMRALAGAARVT